jgi:hypothetical protein
MNRGIINSGKKPRNSKLPNARITVFRLNLYGMIEGGRLIIKLNIALLFPKYLLKK